MTKPAISKTEKPIKILLLEDLPSDVKLIWRVLKKEFLDFQGLAVATREDFIAAIADFVPDIILSDHSLPSFNSHEALHILQQSGKNIPFILVTGTISEDFAVDMIKRGAEDYILKDRLERLPTAIINAQAKYQLQVDSEKNLRDLVQSEFRYRQIVETASEGIWQIDEDNKITFVNKKLCEILEYPKEEMLGKENFDFMEESNKPAVREAIERKMKGVSEIMDVRYVSKTGKLIYASMSANPVFDESGNYKGALAMVTDVTEKKILEDLLRRANSLARIGSWELDLLRKTLYWSSITREIHEVDHEYVPTIETGITFYKEGESRNAIARLIDEAIKNMSSWDSELQIVTANMNTRWIRVIGGAEVINKRCVRLYGTIQDIDASKKAELEVLRLCAEKNAVLAENKKLERKALEQQVVEQRHVTRAVVDAQEKERKVIGEELHDNVNQVLAAAQLYLNYNMSVDPENQTVVKVRDYVKIAMDEIRKLSHALVGPASSSNMSLCDSVNDLIANMFMLKEIAFEFRHDTYMENDSDEGLKLVIYRIVQEQLGNIIKHSAASKVLIEFKQKKKLLEVIVSDNGKGFDPALKRKGIGLSNIKNRAKIYNGTVDVQSAPDKGCTLIVQFRSFVDKYVSA